LRVWKLLMSFCLICLLSAWVLSCGEGDDQDDNRGGVYFPGDDDDAASSDDDDIADDDDTEQLNDDLDDGNDDINDDTHSTDDDYTADVDCSEEGLIDEFGILWITIPSGTFMMGCSPDDEECSYREFPVSEEHVEEFQMTEYLITQDQFEFIMGYNPTNFEFCPSCAIDGIEFNVAENFCLIIGGRLPTEKEWEYAARAGTSTKYYCGNDSSCLDQIAWYEENSGGKPHVVGQKEPNHFCLYDMAGNLHEYTGIDDDPPPRLRSGGFSSPAIGLRHSYPHDSDAPPFDVDGIRCARDIE
jgi:Sulfatase-modifying factor enzyme 1